ncbi:MAG: hypothetical protein ACQET5_11075 [Halobacteriota archaeon]|uniref:hypothetical protein n=1 Tax=Natronomonas sp. TaxID=2184060 RepID=UPI00397554F4
MTYKQITTGVFVLALAFALVATGGFSASELDRNTSIQIVDDDRAAVGLQACYIPNTPPQQERANGGEDGNGPESEDGPENRVTPVGIEITNRLGAELTVRELTVDGTVVHDRPYPATIEPRGHERITVPVRSAPSEVTATVSANGVSTRITVSDISNGECPFPVDIPSPDGNEQESPDESETTNTGGEEASPTEGDQTGGDNGGDANSAQSGSDSQSDNNGQEGTGS